MGALGVAVGNGRHAMRVNYFLVFLFFDFSSDSLSDSYLALHRQRIGNYSKNTTNGIEVNVEIFVAYLWQRLQRKLILI